MLLEDEYFKTLTEDELWRRYCGFLDLSIDEFMGIQNELLMDEIERVADSTLGKKIMNNQKPRTVEEFRRTVPLTTYADYEPYLSERQEDTLAIKPQMWGHSAGRGGYFKWIPYSSEFLDRVSMRCLGAIILGMSGQKGRINFWPGARLLIIMPSPPYASGCLFHSLAERFSYKAMPPLETSQNIEFQERIQLGFRMALKDGVDLMGGIGSVLVKMGEAMSGQARGAKFSPSMLHPKIMFRLLRAVLRTKKQKRAMLPKDLWSPKAIVAGGMDTDLYRNDITYYWGGRPYEIYICAEAFFLAVESWKGRGMVFVPDSVFLEFIPHDKQLKEEDNKDYQPSTVLLDEVEEGKLYEVVITQLYGLPLLRYRLRDIIKVIALRDDETGINLPHITVQRRVGETIDLAGLANLDEKTVWQAIANTGEKYTEWAAVKEYDNNQSFLRLYLELKEKKKANEIASMVDEQLKIVDTDYKDINAYLKLQPVRVTLLSPGTFSRYMEEKQKQGADLAHLKPSHMNPSDASIQRLLELSRIIGEE